MNKKNLPVTPNTMRSNSEELIYTKRRFFLYVQDVLNWYRYSFGKSDVQNHQELKELIDKTEEIYVNLIQENEVIAQKNHVKLIQAITKKTKNKTPNPLRT